MRGVVSMAAPIVLFEDGVTFFFGEGTPRKVDWDELDELARCDHIDPPTGMALKAALLERNGLRAFPPAGREAQIVRWRVGDGA